MIVRYYIIRAEFKLINGRFCAVCMNVWQEDVLRRDKSLCDLVWLVLSFCGLYGSVWRVFFEFAIEDDEPCSIRHRQIRQATQQRHYERPQHTSLPPTPFLFLSLLKQSPFTRVVQAAFKRELAKNDMLLFSSLHPAILLTSSQKEILLRSVTCPP